jgi:hypothetical protein
MMNIYEESTINFWICSANKTDRHDITEILLKVALITITLTLSRNFSLSWYIYIYIFGEFFCGWYLVILWFIE